MIWPMTNAEHEYRWITDLLDRAGVPTESYEAQAHGTTTWTLAGRVDHLLKLLGKHGINVNPASGLSIHADAKGRLFVADGYAQAADATRTRIDAGADPETFRVSPFYLTSADVQAAYVRAVLLAGPASGCAGH